MNSTLEAWIANIGRLRSLLPLAPRTLAHFYDNTDGFRSKTGEVGSKILSHSLCVETSMDFPGEPFDGDAARRKQYEVLLEKPWAIGRPSTLPEASTPKEDPYTVSVALVSFTRLHRQLKADDASALDRIGRGLDVLKHKIAELALEASDARPLDHAMILYRVRRALDVVEREWCAPLANYHHKTPADYRTETLLPTIERLKLYLTNRLYYLLSMCSAIQDNEEDALQLGYIVYALGHYDRFANDVLLAHGTRRAVDILFGGGRHPRVQTIYRDQDLNISASPIEVLTLVSRSGIVRRSFAEYADAYEIVFRWVSATRRDTPASPIWMVEPWRGVSEPEAWVNAHVVEFLGAYYGVLREACGAELLAEFGAVSSKPRVTWSRIMESRGFKEELKTGLIDEVKNNHSRGRRLSKCSVLLYGPPGTAKTSIARAIAWELNWPFVAISPHQFAEEGLDGVIRRARLLFERISILSNCVVLFDELDELVTTRDSEYQKINRFITTSMLPWFQDLRDQAEIVFIATTNHIGHFDPAIKRPGRFDFVLPVGPPEVIARSDFVRNSLIEAGEEAATASDWAHAIEEAVVKIRTGDEPDAAPWPITIGELRLICENITKHALGIAKGEVERRAVVAEVVQRVAQNPLITCLQAREFEGDAVRYRFPPHFGR